MMDLFSLLMPMVAGFTVSTLLHFHHAKSSVSKEERMFPKSENLTLNKIYDSFECIKNGDYKKRDSFPSYLSVDIKYSFKVERYDVSFLLFENPCNSTAYIDINRDTIFKIVINNKTREVLKLENQMNVLSLDETPSFIQAFYDLLGFLEKEQEEKANMEKAIEHTAKNTSKQILLHKSVDQKTPLTYKELFSSFSDRDIIQLLEEIGSKCSYIEEYRNQLDLEHQHTYERISDVMLPDLLRSFLRFSEVEQKKHKNDLLNALAVISKEAESIELVINRSKEFDFQKKIAIIKQ